jgi:DsbC/DsbD-like thiol-disulfide interchange protein
MKLHVHVAVSFILAMSLTTAMSDEPEAPLTSRCVVTIKTRLERSAPGKEIVIVRFEVRDGWHIYANPPGADDFVPAQTTVKILSKDAAKVHIDYPAGKDREVDGIRWKSYEGTVEIRATVERDADAKCPLEAEIRFQASDEKSCLMPDTVRIPLTCP